MGRMAYCLKDGYVWNPLRGYPRNFTCFCGSGARFKHCCVDDIPKAVPQAQGIRLQKLLRHVHDGTITPEMIAQERKLEAAEASARAQTQETAEEVCSECRGAGMILEGEGGEQQRKSCPTCVGTGLSQRAMRTLTADEVQELLEQNKDRLTEEEKAILLKAIGSGAVQVKL